MQSNDGEGKDALYFSSALAYGDRAAGHEQFFVRQDPDDKLTAPQLDIDPAKITMDSDIMGDFEADSLDIVDMVMTLEDEFGIEVPDDAIENLRTVGDVVKFVDSHQG